VLSNLPTIGRRIRQTEWWINPLVMLSLAVSCMTHYARRDTSRGSGKDGKTRSYFAGFLTANVKLGAFGFLRLPHPLLSCESKKGVRNDRPPARVRGLTRNSLFFLGWIGFVFFDRFWFFAFRLGFLLRTAFFAFFAFFRFFIALASVIGLVEAGPFENYPCPGADKPFQPLLSAVRAHPQRFGCYHLEPLKFLPATFA